MYVDLSEEDKVIYESTFEIAYKLQDLEYQVDRLIAFRNALVDMMTGKALELPCENFEVSQQLKYVDLYSVETNYQTLTYEDTLYNGSFLR